jgi:uracil-DNA glycosylase
MTNLKKSGGGGSSKYLDIREYANSTTPLWKQELEIMNPDIILCCGTFRIVTDLLGLQVIKMDSHRGYYSVWKRDNGNSILVRFYHPAARFRKGVLYNLLKENLLELREKGLW